MATYRMTEHGAHGHCACTVKYLQETGQFAWCERVYTSPSEIDIIQLPAQMAIGPVIDGALTAVPLKVDTTETEKGHADRMASYDHSECRLYGYHVCYV